MATILLTELKCFLGTTTSGTQIGSTISDATQGGPSSVALNNSTLGASLSPGEQYCVTARCTNDESYTSSWTDPYPFKTLILAELSTLTGGAGNLSPELTFTYNRNVISVQSCGVYVSTNAGGANATKITAADEQQAESGWTISSLSENTLYYAIPFVIDDLGREYTDSWSNAETANTSYSAPTVTVSNLASTYNSISGNLSVSTNDTLSSVYIDLWPTGGVTHYKINKSAVTGSQSFTITNGDTDSSSTPQTIVINPSTEYRITVYAVNTSGATGSGQGTITTAAQSHETIAITGIQDVTPTSAVVTLSYGGGNNSAVIDPGENQ